MNALLTINLAMYSAKVCWSIGVTYILYLAINLSSVSIILELLVFGTKQQSNISTNYEWEIIDDCLLWCWYLA